MSRNARPHYRPGLGWILGVAFVDTLTRPVRLAQGFTLVRCHGSPRASSPHGLTAPGSGVSRRLACVQLPLARGCYQLAPRRTFTSNPVPMSGTPTPSLREAPATTHDEPNRQRIHLTEPKRCLDEAGHLWVPYVYRSSISNFTWPHSRPVLGISCVLSMR